MGIKDIESETLDKIAFDVGEIPLSILVGMRLEGMTLAEIGEKCGHGRSWACKRLKRWTLSQLTYFKKHRADIMAVVGDQLLECIESKIESGAVLDESLKDLMGSFSKIYDRERVERGLSTGGYRNIKELDEREKEIIEEQRKLRLELEKEGKVRELKASGG